jgi:hypothetical protein
MVMEKRNRGIKGTEAGRRRVERALYRKEHTLDQKECAVEELNAEIDGELETVSRSTIQRFCTEEGIDASNIRCIAKALGLSPIEIVDPIVWYSRMKIKEPTNFVPVTNYKLEDECYSCLVGDGTLVRIKAPRKMGKTLFIKRVIKLIERTKEREKYAVVQLDISDAREILANTKESEITKPLENFLQWFCYKVARVLELPDQMEELWDKRDLCIPNTTYYFEQHILNHSKTKNKERLILILENTDCIFESPLSDYICQLFRRWYDLVEKSRTDSNNWTKFRLVIIHSTEVYGKLAINHSPLNVGQTFEPRDLDSEQVIELARREGLSSRNDTIQGLEELVGGYPSLVHQAIQSIKESVKSQNEGRLLLIEEPPEWYLSIIEKSCQSVIAKAPTEDGIYAKYLHELIGILEVSELTEIFRTVVISGEPVQLQLTPAFKLYSMGLIKRVDGGWVPRCPLYRDYFRNYFEHLENHS